MRSILSAVVCTVLVCALSAVTVLSKCTDASKARVPKIAVIGSGMAGASVAWRLAHDSDEEVDLSIFEADDRIGGRLDEVTVRGQFEEGVTEKVVELGGTMGIEANRYFVEVTDMLNLTREVMQDPTFGIFDGHSFTMTSETPIWRKAWRYRWSPYFQKKLTSSIVKKFLHIYELQDQGVTFSSALNLWKGLGMDDLLQVSLSDHLQKNTKVLGLTTINKHYINEVVAGQVRVNYNQNPHEIAALAGHIGLAPDSTAFKVAEGTSRLPKGLISHSGAHVHIKSTVSHISREGSFWNIQLAGKNYTEKFDMVVLAAPLSRANISFSGLHLSSEGGSGSMDSIRSFDSEESSAVEMLGNLEAEAAADPLRKGKSIPGKDIEDVKYQTVYTTYVRGNPKPEFFKSCHHKHPHATCRGPKNIPEIILTSENSDTAFSCVGTFWKPAEYSTEHSSEYSGTRPPARLSKLFSVGPLNDMQVEEMFDEPKIVAQKFWKAYPKFVPPEVEEGRMQLAPGLYYTNALEAGASCIEIAAVAARNVAMLIDRELKDRSRIHTCA